MIFFLVIIGAVILLVLLFQANNVNKVVDHYVETFVDALEGLGSFHGFLDFSKEDQIIKVNCKYSDELIEEYNCDIRPNGEVILNLINLKIGNSTHQENYQYIYSNNKFHENAHSYFLEKWRDSGDYRSIRSLTVPIKRVSYYKRAAHLHGVRADMPTELLVLYKSNKWILLLDRIRTHMKRLDKACSELAKNGRPNFSESFLGRLDELKWANALGFENAEETYGIEIRMALLRQMEMVLIAVLKQEHGPVAA